MKFSSVTSGIELLVSILTDKKALEAETYEMQLRRVTKRSFKNYQKTHVSKAEAETFQTKKRKLFINGPSEKNELV